MNSILKLLQSRKVDFSKPFLTDGVDSLNLTNVTSQNFEHLNSIKQGDVVALIGDFNANTIADFLQLVERRVILMPLTIETAPEHDYFFESGLVDWVVQDGISRKIEHRNRHHLLDELRKRENPGLILFSTGTTGRPKAILHDFTFFLQKYLTPRPSLITLNFLLFDHIGGINTLLHSMFNSGLIVSIKTRSVEEVIKICKEFNVEVLPTTPTFLRMLLMSGITTDEFPDSLKIITYGTERMDEFTLLKLNEILPEVDFRQTFGMSELGILRVKSESKQSLFMKIGGEGIEWKVDDKVLKIKSDTRMMGYLNSESPFDSEGWYDTKDLVEVRGEFLKVVGRTTNTVNVGGLKFLTSEVEAVGLSYPGVADLSITVKTNPITGQHIEMIVQVDQKTLFDQENFKKFLGHKLPRHMVPRRIIFGDVQINHRFKKS